MNAVYDKQTDSLYISPEARGRRETHESQEIDSNIFLDKDEFGAPIGMEILFASRFFELDKLKRYTEASSVSDELRNRLNNLCDDLEITELGITNTGRSQSASFVRCDG